MKYFDWHCDTLTEMRDIDETLYENRRDLDLRRVSAFARTYGQMFAIWKDAADVPAGREEETFLALHRKAVRYLKNENNRISLCTSCAEMEAAERTGKYAAFLSIEDLSLMGREVRDIRKYGIRFALLTWNYANRYGSGAAADQTAGLTAEGKEIVRFLDREGVFLDISHLSDAGTRDVFTLTDAPVIASHSDVRAVCGAPRNLEGWQIREIIARRGIIGMNFFSPFVSDDNPSFEALIRHMDAVLSVPGGEDVLAFGGDFDGCGPGLIAGGMRGVEDIPRLRDAMLAHGFSEDLTEKLFWDNSEAFLRRNL